MRIPFKWVGLGGVCAFVVGIASISSQAALAQSPTDAETTGTATGGAGGTASVQNIADLKTPISAADYDDDPAGEPGSPLFHVTPNLDDDPIETANKYVFIRFPGDVNQLQVTIRTRPGGTVVFDALVAGNTGLTGQACVDLLGSVGTAGTVADGLVDTGQKTAEEIQNLKNWCIQQTAAVYVVPWTISKHLPPGVYDQCVAISHLGGGSTPRVCVQIVINAITGYETDVDVIDYGQLRQNVLSIAEGDFTEGAGGGTVVGTGNTSPILTVMFSWMQNTTFDPGTDKYIRSEFDVQINRRDAAGDIVDWQHIGGLLGGDDPDSANPFAGATPAVLSEICLEPNEPLKLDFSVIPRDVLYDGPYSGLVRLTVADSDTSQLCAPTLGSGESSTGDSNGTFNNLPGQAVEQPS